MGKQKMALDDGKIIRVNDRAIILEFNDVSQQSNSEDEEFEREMEVKNISDEAKTLKSLPEILAMIEEDKLKKRNRPVAT